MDIYLKVPHSNDNDADYFVFINLESATRYVKDEKIEKFVISTEVMDIPADDYTFQV